MKRYAQKRELVLLPRILCRKGDVQRHHFSFSGANDDMHGSLLVKRDEARMMIGVFLLLVRVARNCSLSQAAWSRHFLVLNIS